MTRRNKVAFLLRHVTAKPRGQTLVLVSFGLLAVVGIAGLAVDVGQLWTTKRLMQNAADAAATAAVDEIAVGATGSITSAALAAAAQNGFTNGSGTAASPNPVTVAVYNPPQSGPYNANANAVQVIVSQDQPTYFMQVLGYPRVSISTAAVALAVSGGACIYTLDPSASGALTVTGGAALTSACGIYVDSNSSSALTVGGSSSVQAPLIGVVGGTSINGSGSTSVTTGIAAFGDPLAYVQPPAVSSCSDYKGSNINSNVTLNPGLYCGGIKINAGANVTFNPGTYVINGSGLTVLAGATVTGSGVTFYLTGQNKSDSNPGSYGGVNISSGSTVNLSAPCDSSSGGIEAMLFFQDRSITNGVGSSINGGGTATFSGALYFPTTPLSYSGGSASGGYTILVSDMLTLNGAANVGNNYSCLADGSPIKNAALAQ